MIRDVLQSALAHALGSVGVPVPEAGIGLERPASRDHGDWSSNVAMASAKTAGQPPRELAASIIAELDNAGVAHVDRVEIAGPGFINFWLNDSWLHEQLIETLTVGAADFGRSLVGAGERVLVEFVSVNPTGPLHAGHARGAIYGDSLVRLLQHCGYEVGREYLFNDRGVQMQHFAASLQAAANGEPTPEDGYVGEYITEWAAEIPEGAEIGEWGYNRAKSYIAETLAMIGVHFDVWFSERELVASGAMDDALDELTAAGHTYEADGATWLRSTDFADDKDRVLVRSDGEPTYLLPDIAYHRDKLARGWDHLINVLGADHHGYVARLKAGIAGLGFDPGCLETPITQLVRLERDGEEVRIGKRSGQFIELREIIDEVGADATRFTYLLQSIDSQQSVDLAAIAAQSMDNPVFYVQMAHARACSIQANARAEGFVALPAAQVSLEVLEPLESERELDVLRALSEFDELVELACRERAPHKITTWVRQLGSAFHGFYHDCYVVGDGVSEAQTQARLQLVEGARIGIAAGLALLGVSAPQEMR